MKLFKVLAGTSKERMKPVMIDELHKCDNYIDSRWHIKIQVGQIKKGDHSGNGKGMWVQVVEAEPDAEPWRKENSKSKMWRAYDRADRGILPRSK